MPYSPDRRLFIFGGTAALINVSCSNSNKEPVLSQSELARRSASPILTPNPALGNRRISKPGNSAASRISSETTRIRPALEDSLPLTAPDARVFNYGHALAGVFLPDPKDGSTGGIVMGIAPNSLPENTSPGDHLLVPVSDDNLPVAIAAYFLPVNRSELVINLQIGVPAIDKVPRGSWESMPYNVGRVNNTQTLAARWRNWVFEEVELNKQPLLKKPAK